MELTTKKHFNPVWQEKADFIIRGKCFNSKNELIAQEQIWAHQISEDIFEICCIPFFLQDLSLGDIVKTDSQHWIIKSIKHSGHYTIRIWFGDSKSQIIRNEILDAVTRENYLLEWHTNNLLAIDIPSKLLVSNFAEFLGEQEALGELVFEVGQRIADL